MEFSDLLLDLQNNSFDQPIFPAPPYKEEDDFERKFKNTLKNLQKSIRRKERLLSLINAYYLGFLLDQLPTATKRLKYKHQMSVHYATMVERTFDIFEICPEQIMKTQIITVQIIRKLKQEKIKELRDEILFFAGSQNLEEEPVTLSDAVGHVSN